MNWDVIGVVADLFGAIAVVVTLIYLATQIRQTSSIARASAFQSIFDGLTNHNNYMFGPENVDLVTRCLCNYPNVESRDRVQFDNLMSNLMNYFESSYEASEAQTLGESTLENWRWWFETKIFCYEGAAAWWSDSKNGFPQYIQTWVEKRIAAADPSTDYFGIRNSNRPTDN
jgi:hypothetical protein